MAVLACRSLAWRGIRSNPPTSPDGSARSFTRERSPGLRWSGRPRRVGPPRCRSRRGRHLGSGPLRRWTESRPAGASDRDGPLQGALGPPSVGRFFESFKIVKYGHEVACTRLDLEHLLRGAGLRVTGPRLPHLWADPRRRLRRRSCAVPDPGPGPRLRDRRGRGRLLGYVPDLRASHRQGRAHRHRTRHPRETPKGAPWLSWTTQPPPQPAPGRPAAARSPTAAARPTGPPTGVGGPSG